jgi:hypothetical protein
MKRYTGRTWGNLLVTKLHHAVQILKGLLLSTLSLAELVNQVRFHTFELFDLLVYLTDGLVALFLLELVLLGDVLFNLKLVDALECKELFLVL